MPCDTRARAYDVHRTHSLATIDQHYENGNTKKNVRCSAVLPSLPGREAPSLGRGREVSKCIGEQLIGSTSVNGSHTSRRSRRRSQAHTSSPLHTMPG